MASSVGALVKSLNPFDKQRQAEERARKAFHGSVCVRNYDNCVIGKFTDSAGLPYVVDRSGVIRRTHLRLSKKQKRQLKANLERNAS